MTNHRATTDHNICGSRSISSAAASDSVSAAISRSQGGYTLVALLATMSVLALFAMAIAPSARHQALREREKEAIFRGEQVAEAIKLYYTHRVRTSAARGDQALPSSMDQLLQGVPVQGGSKNRQILRLSASRDPLTIEGEWRFVLPRSEGLIDLQQSIMFFSGNIVPTPRDPQMAQLQQLAAPRLVSMSNLAPVSSSSGSSSSVGDTSGPFVGVASRSKQESVLAYYGLERHDQWIFTPLFRQ